LKKVKFEFVKYQACGNDFILRDDRGGISIPEEKKPKIVRILCDRHFGVGADGVLFVEESKGAHGRMRLFCPDGQEAFMCGNGIRCVADYLYNDLKEDKLLIDTKDGVKKVLRIGENLYQVSMGKLRYTMKDLSKFFKGDFRNKEILLEKEMVFPDIGKLKISIVSTGEPHVVIFVKDLENEDISKYGNAIAKNFDMFPYGVNTNLCEVIDDKTVRVRTYESGAYYETMACGTGATACAAVAYFTGKVKNNKVEVITKGGRMVIEVSEDNLLMTGPAHLVFRGEIYLSP